MARPAWRCDGCSRRATGVSLHSDPAPRCSAEIRPAPAASPAVRSRGSTPKSGGGPAACPCSATSTARTASFSTDVPSSRPRSSCATCCGSATGSACWFRFPRTNPTSWTFQELTKGYWAGPALLAALAPARLVAATDLSLIIQGPTGVGKEGAAQAIHAWSRREGPFVAVNCATLETLAEAQLFGYRKGAFTGADHSSPGFLRAAEGGTLFLDEIADLSMPVQAKLLRAVEQREVVPLGESKAVSINVRLLTATQSPLSEAVEETRFRADLLARLEGLTVPIPPLRERAEEVPFLFAKLVEQSAGPRWSASPRPAARRTTLRARLAVQRAWTRPDRATIGRPPSRRRRLRPLFTVMYSAQISNHRTRVNAFGMRNSPMPTPKPHPSAP